MKDTISTNNTHIGSSKFENKIYQEKQKIIRTTLQNYIRRNNGLVTQEEFDIAFNSNEKLKNRLFKTTVDNLLEWKNDIQDISILSKKIGRDITKVKEIVQLFFSSRLLEKRTNTSYLTIANNKAIKHKSVSSFSPLFGFDLLLRPITQFSNTEKKSNNFHIGQSSLVIFIHANIDSNGNFNNIDDFMIRANMGKDALNLGISNYINSAIQNKYNEFKSYIQNNEYRLLTTKICETCNEAIRKWEFSGV